MKKIMMIACMMLMSIGAFAQDAPFAVGANVNYGFASNYKQVGFGAKFQYEFIENVRAELGGKYFLKKDGLSVWSGNLNFHYLIPVGESFKVYPILGAALVGMSPEHGSGETMFGFNAGAGVEYALNEQLKLEFEAIYQYAKKTKDHIEYKVDWPIISLGIAYVF